MIDKVICAHNLLNSYHLPQRKLDIKEITDAGRPLSPVSSANKEVQFHQTEIFLIEQLYRLNRVHTACHDSGPNPSERLNAAIGRAVADGGTIHWNYNQQRSPAEIEKLTPDDFQDIEKDYKWKQIVGRCEDL